MKKSRRTFIKSIPVLSLLPLGIDKPGQYPISSNTYDWLTFFRRDGKEWGKDLDEDIKLYATSGLTAIEPSLDSVQQAINYIAVLKKYNIQMPSIYVGSVLHQAQAAHTSILKILEIADIVKAFGTKIIVTNPNPISWAQPENKSDEALKTQAIALEDLGTKLRAKGLHLAYHTHNMELRAGAREFHHMLQNTNAKNVSFCFDVHWVYRGSDDSELAVFDVLKMYGHRVIELHIRQSQQGIWKETFSAEGDIDYSRFAAELKRLKVMPHLVIEQCLEEKTPNTMSVVEAHRMDLMNVKRVFR
ncbi:MAG: TIM barrel protein [Saprospiraceae bacterium]|nr:TIM barrel protein [Saprospiraceae bacterium]